MNDSNNRFLDITPDPAILELFKNLKLDDSSCFAELIDNSLDNFRSSGSSDCAIDIMIESDTVTFSDNGSGMTPDQLEQALKAGFSSKKKVGELGLFGIGFNVATIKLGVETIVITKTAHDKKWLRVPINVSELRQRQSFKIEATLINHDTTQKAGTFVVIKLRPELAGKLARARSVAEITDRLGRIYSYVLRDSVPGLSGRSVGESRAVKIRINGKTISPVLPCIWSDSRTLANGENAVIYIDEKLSDVEICQTCGVSREINVHGPCSNCGGNIQLTQERRVWGWLGVQRSLETQEYGINLLRNGRTIELNSKEFFAYKDPSTNKDELEYPIEQTTQGRIVGEIHCDHVNVEFTKQHFLHEDMAYRGVHQIVRGMTWIRPNYAVQATGQKNESPLARIFSGVRRNDPGTKYLTPGNGQKAIIKEARNWANKFRHGDPDYWTDQIWWDACVNHDEIVNPPATNTGGNSSVVSPTGGTSIISPLPSSNSVTSPVVPATPPVASKTLSDRANEWRVGGRIRPDLSKSIYLKSIDYKFEVTVTETVQKIQTTDSEPPRAAYLLPKTGSNFEIFIGKYHELFEKWGRSTTDIALGEMASYLSKQGKKSSFSVVLAELMKEYPDEETSEATTRRRVEELRTIIRHRLKGVLNQQDFKDIWLIIPEIYRDEIQIRASDDSVVDFSKFIEDGEFFKYANWPSVKTLVEQFPEVFFNGHLFTPSLGGSMAAGARERVIRQLSSAFEDLFIFESVAEGISNLEQSRALLSVNFIFSKMSDD